MFPPYSLEARLSRLLLAALLLISFGFSPLAHAAGTASGTSISNTATVNFSVGGVAQTAVTSSAATFVVDTKVDLTVATSDAAAVSVSPGATNQVLTYSVTNTGNKVQDFSLTSIAVATGVAAKFGGLNDSLDASSVSVYVEDGTTASFQPAEDTATFIDELAADASQTVYIVSTIPSTATNGQIASYHLLAEARAGGSSGGSVGAALTETAGADTQGSVDIVFADGQGSDTANDGARDAKHSSQDDYSVAGAVLTVSKTSTVVSDPSNNTSNPKRIPGAVVEYTITVSNAAGAADATGITVTDALDTANLTFKTDGYAAGAGIEYTFNGGAATNLTNAGGDDAGDYGVTAADTVTVTGITLSGGQNALIKFQATIN